MIIKHAVFTLFCISDFQQDCQEFLAVLLDHLHEHLMDGHSSANSVAAPPPLQTIVSQIFQGQLKNKVECLRCGHVSMKFEPFVYLSLPLPGAHERKIGNAENWLFVCMYNVYKYGYLYRSVLGACNPGLVYALQSHKVSTSFLVGILAHFPLSNRVVVTVLKQDSICGLKKAVCELLGLSIDCDLLVTAEVKQGCITKILVCTNKRIAYQTINYVILLFVGQCHCSETTLNEWWGEGLLLRDVVFV